MVRKDLIIRFVCPTFCIIVFSIPAIVYSSIGVPYKRGFFCDDPSIRHPYHKNTVSVGVLVGLGLIPIIMIVIVETSRLCVRGIEDLMLHLSTLAHNIFFNWISFCLGVTITELSTSIGKFTIGRLRPHFISVCQPFNLTGVCSGGVEYVENFKCTSNFSHRDLKETRLSFPSDQSSHAMFFMLYTTLYLQRNVTKGCLTLSFIKIMVQTSLLLIALFIGLSRVSDYLNHWSDVIAGFALGAIVAVFITLHVSTIFVEIPMDSNLDKITPMSKQGAEPGRPNTVAMFSKCFLEYSAKEGPNSLIEDSPVGIAPKTKECKDKLKASE